MEGVFLPHSLNPAMRQASCPRRRAFTMIELLVVIAITAIVLGLLLTAVQRVRAAAARLRSMNNLHQIAVATQNYNDSFRVLPDNVSFINNSPSNAAFSSVFVKILPYVEQGAAYNSALENGMSALRISVPVYVSPADGSLTGSTVGLTSYVANDYVFGRAGGNLARSFPDGTSNTLLFTERYMACGSAPAYNAWAIRHDGAAVNGYSTTLAARLMTEAAPQFSPHATSGTPLCIPGRASTPQADSILTAMADASVRGVSAAGAGGRASWPGGPINNWQAALTPDLGEILGPGW